MCELCNKHIWLCASKGKPIQKGSVPKKKLIYNGITYEYYGESVKY